MGHIARRPWVLAAACALSVSVIAISGESYWIDEASTVWHASHVAIGEWWRGLVGQASSDTQMPIYMLYVWVWQKVFGHGEVWMRAANVPWLVLGLVGAAWCRRHVLALATVSPFLWYYLNEARPYAMQIGASMLIAGALWRLAQGQREGAFGDSRRESLALAFGITMLAGSSLLGMVWAGGALVVTWFVLGRSKVSELLAGGRTVWLVTGVVLCALGAYYAFTLTLGARAASMGGPGVTNLLFVGYELLGFSGLGPGRVDLRSSGVVALKPYLIPLTVYGVLVLLVMLSAARALSDHRHSRMAVRVGVVLAGVAGCLFAVGVVTRFRVLGRHYAPLLPATLICLSVGLGALWERRSTVARTIVVAFAAMSLVSCLSLRLAQRHARDDYRGAAAIALESVGRGDVVWWSADKIAGQYYGLSMVLPGAPARDHSAWAVLNPSPEALDQLAVPQIIVVSKPDLFDNHGVLAAYLARSDFQPAERLPAFVVWRRARQ